MKSRVDGLARTIALANGQKRFNGGQCKHGHDGVRYVSNGSCVECSLLRGRERPSHPSEIGRRNWGISWTKRYREDREFREDCLRYQREWRKNNPLTNEQRKLRQEYRKQHYLENTARYVMFARAREKKTAKATPYWLTPRQRREMESFYERAASLTKVTCILHEVDHIVPLQARTVCGLNVPWNLQVLTAEENRRKHDGLPWAGELICRAAKGYRGRPGWLGVTETICKVG